MMRLFPSRSIGLPFPRRKPALSDERDSEDFTDSSRTLLLADVRDGLVAVNRAEDDLVQEILEFHRVLSLLTGIPARLDLAGLPAEADSIQERSVYLSTRLTESEKRLDVLRDTKRRLLMAEERLAAESEHSQYGPGAAQSVNGKHNDHDGDDNVLEERHAVYGSPG